LVDLEQTPWPWQAGSVEELRAHHSLEHMGQATNTFLNIMYEAYRVLQPDGLFYITFPDVYGNNWWGDPTHVRPLVPYTFTLFDQEMNRVWIAHNAANTCLGIRLGIDFRQESMRLKKTKRYQHIGGAEFQDAMEMRNNVVEEWTIVLTAKK
jgi:SAM-dependent methyltransferase